MNENGMAAERGQRTSLKPARSEAESRRQGGHEREPNGAVEEDGRDDNRGRGRHARVSGCSQHPGHAQRIASNAAGQENASCLRLDGHAPSGKGKRTPARRRSARHLAAHAKVPSA